MYAANLVLPRVANMKRVPDCPWPAGARALVDSSEGCFVSSIA